MEFKVLICGDGAIGKTCLLDTLTERCEVDWENPEYISTAADCHIERYDIEGVGESEIEFWDTAGQEALVNLRFMAYPGTQVLLIAFDLTEPISLENVEHSWIEEFRDICSDCPCTILVGTKLDRHPGRPLDESLTDNIQQVAQNIGANAVVLTSAKTHDGVLDDQCDACPLTGQYLREVIMEMCGKIAAGMDIPVYEPFGSGVSIEIEMPRGGDEISRRPTVGDLVTLTNSSDDEVYVITSDDHDGEPYCLRTHHDSEVRVPGYYREDEVQLASGAGQKAGRLTVGDRVVRSDGASGKIIQDDHDSQPYNVLLDNGETCWCREDEVRADESSSRRQNRPSFDGGYDRKVVDPEKAKQLAKQMGLSLEDLNELFSYFDTDGSGLIDPQEFGSLLAALGAPLSQPMLQAVVKQLDQNDDGMIDMDEFVSWLVSRDWSFNFSESDFEEKFLQSAKKAANQPPSYAYDWDYSISEKENIKASKEAIQKAADESQAFERPDDVLEKKRKMLYLQLMIPFFIKKGLRMVNSCGADDASGASQNSFIFQVGDPNPKGAMEFYIRPCGPKAFRETKPADKKSCSAAVLDFEVREDAADEDLEAIAMILNELFEEHVNPLIQEFLRDVPLDLKRSGLMAGEVFEGLRIATEVVDGKKVLRIVGFSGLNPSGLLKDCLVDLEQLLPKLSLKLTRGFNLEDLLKSDTPLSELLTFTTEINFEWHVKLAELVSRFFCNMEIMDRGQRSDSRGAMDNKAEKAAAIAACKFFQAQRSLLFFKFKDPVQCFKETVKDDLVDLFFEEENAPGYKAVREGVVEGPPSAETVDAVLEAISKVSGKTIDSARKRFLSEFYIPFHARRMEEDLALPMDALRLFLKEGEAILIGQNESGDASPNQIKFAEAALKGIRLYFKAQAALKGLSGCKVVSRIFEAGIKLDGLGNIFELLPSFEEFQNKGEPIDSYNERQTRGIRAEPGPQWVPKYARSVGDWIEGGEKQPYRPSLEYLNGLHQDFSELIDIVKAAWSYIESAKPPIPDEIRNRAEEEAKMMFGMIDPVEGQTFDTIGEADFRVTTVQWAPPEKDRAPPEKDTF